MIDGGGMIRPYCRYCGKPAASKGFSKSGKRSWRLVCSACHERIKKGLPIINRVMCAECGFVAAHPCQLDVDHIDGDSKNNAPENFQVLCANCHRLKTVLNEEWKAFGTKIDKQLKLFCSSPHKQ